jgi:hypothetical protein
MTASAVLMAICAWGLTVCDGFYGRLFYFAAIAYCAASIAMAVKLIDSREPLIRAGPEGIEFNSALGKRGLIPWDEVRSLKFHDIHLHMLTLFGMGQLVCRVRGDYPLGFGLRWLPFGWFGICAVPGRFAKGGSRAMRQFSQLIRLLRAERGSLGANTHGLFDHDMVMWNVLKNVTLPTDMSKLMTGERLGGAMTAATIVKNFGASAEDGDRLHYDLVNQSVQQSGLPETMHSLAREALDPQAEKKEFGRKRVPLLNGKPLR